jgi:plasmid stabilization system protein ParE
MKRFVLTASAKQDVNNIWDFIANDSIEAADWVLDALDNAMVKHRALATGARNRPTNGTVSFRSIPT